MPIALVGSRFALLEHLVIYSGLTLLGLDYPSFIYYLSQTAYLECLSYSDGAGRIQNGVSWGAGRPNK